MPDPIHERLVVSPSDYLTGDPVDAIKDRKAELAHDGTYVTDAEIVRASLAAHCTHDVYGRNLARHPFGLPATGTTSLARAMTPDAPAAHPSPAAGADGSPDFPAAA